MSYWASHSIELVNCYAKVANITILTLFLFVQWIAVLKQSVVTVRSTFFVSSSTQELEFVSRSFMVAVEVMETTLRVRKNAHNSAILTVSGGHKNNS